MVKVKDEELLQILSEIEENGLSRVEYKEENNISRKKEAIFGNFNTIFFQLENKLGKTLTVHRIKKAAESSQVLRTMIPFRKLWEKEIYFYTTVVPAFKKLKSDDAEITYFPKYVSSGLTPIEFIVMENMTKPNYNYVVKDCGKPLDFPHLMLAAQEYGRFHALSYVLKHTNMNKFNEMSINMKDEYFQYFSMDTIKVLGYNHFLNHAVGAYDKSANEFQKIKLYKLRDALFNNVKDLLTASTTDKSSVIIHGDCNTSNLLFKYEDDDKKKPVSMLMVDWQLSVVSSPAMDLTCLLFAATDKEARNKYWEQLVKEYYTSLSEFLKHHQMKVENWLTYEDLLKEIERCAPYGLFISIMKLYTQTAKEDNIPEFSTAQSAGKLDLLFSKFINTNINEYNIRMRDIISDYLQKGYPLLS